MLKSACTVICLLSILVLFLASCRPFEKPATKYPIVAARTLLLDATAFPPTWDADPCGPDCARDEGYGKAMRIFGRRNIAGHVIQEITNYVYASSAQNNFQRAQATNFPRRDPNEPPFSTAPSITYTSPFADQYALGCGIDIVPACRLYAQYGNYYVYMFFNIDSGTGEGLQVADVTPILKALDQQLATQLHITP
jgi:hypothetical protein